MNKVGKLALNFVLIFVLIIALLVGNNAVEVYESAINSVLCPPIVDTEALEQTSAQGQEMALKIMEEGAVLLQNNDATLPLDYNTDKKINVFGWRSVDWIHGSGGKNSSGGVASEDGTWESTVDLLEALESYGIQYNKRLEDMYCSYSTPDRIVTNIKAQYIHGLTYLREPNITDKNYYSDDLLSYSESFSDVAIVVIGRMAGENNNCDQSQQVKEGPGSSNDPTRHFLELSTEEEALLKYVGANYEKVIVVLNTANPFECGFLETIEGIDACLYVGYTGTKAVNAIPKLLYGESTPSGHTVDTFPYDMYTNPANIFSLPLTYSDYDRNYLDIVENIYGGYKWYETADAENYWDEYSNEFGTGYDAVVQFPFGFGLSYTTFEWEVGDISIAPGSDIDDKTVFSIPVTVTNTGSYAGKEVVGVYVTAPYNKGGIEKSEVALVGFNKTELIQPGASQTISVEIDAYDFLSYDCYDKNNNGHKGYELEAGEYVFSLRTDSHTVKTVTYGGQNVDGLFKYNVPKTIKVTHDPITGKEIKNLFTGDDAIDATPLDAADDGFTPDIPWLTREGFISLDEIKAAYKPRAATPSAKINPVNSSYRQEQANAWNNATTDAFGNPVVNETINWGTDHGLRLAENGVITELGKKLGADYYAEEWDDVLEQLTISEIVSVINNYYGTKAMPSVGKPALTDLDGPCQIKGFSTVPRGTGYPTMVVLASAWNANLAYKFGQSFGDDMNALGVKGLWGFALDNHRSAFNARSHESPSEDAFLSGTMVANAVKGVNTRGCYTFIKHFSVYTTGYNIESIGSCASSVWITEQAYRENYLKAYRMAFVEGGSLGCMTSYDGLGAEHAETSTALISGVLRNEWDFKGAITTDYIPGSWDPYLEALIRAGGNLGMNATLVSSFDSTSSPRFQNRLKEVAHEILYMWLRADYNADQYKLNPDVDENIVSSNSIDSWCWWKPAVKCITICVSVGLVVWGEYALLNFFDPRRGF